MSLLKLLLRSHFLVFSLWTWSNSSFFISYRPEPEERIEKHEKTPVSSKSRKEKGKEAADERRRVAVNSKLQVILFRHKELLKKDILKKRTLLEKEMQIEIQVSILLQFP